MPKRLVSDWDNVGMKGAIVQLKTDQGPAMVTLQAAIQEVRKREVIWIHSPVGESECNGRVENAIRRVQEKVRVSRHQLEDGIKQRLHDDAPIVAWLARWAAEIISKYAPGDDGRKPFERIRREKCNVPLVPFGEIVLYLQPKTVRRNKGDPAKREGVWLGTIDRSEESIVGTEHGVVKC